MHDLGRFFAVNPHMLLEVATLAESFSTDLQFKILKLKIGLEEIEKLYKDPK